MLGVTSCRAASRNGLCNVEVPCPLTTSRVLGGFKSAQQRLLARSVCGGYLSPAAKASWDDLESPLCELCGAPSDKHHQLFHCPATASLRRAHHDVLTWVQKHAPHWAHGASAVAHEEEPFLRLVHSTRRLSVAPRHESTCRRCQSCTSSLMGPARSPLSRRHLARRGPW